jgi:hypothetical protein
VCSELLQRCVQCVSDNDCGEDEVCAGDLCRPACDSDKDCQAHDLLCAAELGYCVDCSSQNDCGKEQYCSVVGTCVRDVCAPDTKRCEDNQLLVCNEIGSGFSAVTCSGGCSEEGEEPACVGLSGEGGGSGVEPPSSGGTPSSNNDGGSPGSSAEGGSGNEPSSGGTTSGGTDPGGAPSSGGASGGSGGASGGSGGAGGSSANGGSAASGGTAGTPSDPFPPSTSACALLSTCPTCCREVGVFALGNSSIGEDLTSVLVESFTATPDLARATFSFTEAGQIGAIYVALSSLTSFAELSITSSVSSGGYEMALSRESGASGCVYAYLNPGWSRTGCWGTSSSTWDQIEIRVRSIGAGTSELSVTNVAYE